MYYLIDANIFIKVICDNIYGVANICHESGCEIAITKTILDELDPGYYKEQENPNLKDTHRIVNNLITGNQGIQLIRMIRLEDVKGAKEELKKILPFTLWTDLGLPRKPFVEMHRKSSTLKQVELFLFPYGLYSTS